jgi:hypothetical protein
MASFFCLSCLAVSSLAALSCPLPQNPSSLPVWDQISHKVSQKSPPTRPKLSPDRPLRVISLIQPDFLYTPYVHTFSAKH